MNNNIEFLNYIKKNSEMGVTSIDELLPALNNEEFRNLIVTQQDGYRSINEEAISLINNLGYVELEASKLTQITTYISIKINLLKDKSISHISEMLIQGSTMGIIDINKKINSFKDCDKKVITLAKELLDLEETYIEDLQPFLKEKEK